MDSPGYTRSVKIGYFYLYLVKLPFGVRNFTTAVHIFGMAAIVGDRRFACAIGWIGVTQQALAVWHT